MVNLYLQAIKQRDFEKVYDLLAPTMIHEIGAIYANTKQMVSLVNRYYPLPSRAATLREINASSIDKATNAKTFFAKIMGQRRFPELGTWAEYGTRVKNTTITGDKAVVTTLKGDRFELVKITSGEWRLLYRADGFVRARKLTETNLERIKRNVVILKRVRK